jgi:hypothetical protein
MADDIQTNIFHKKPTGFAMGRVEYYDYNMKT